MTEAAHVETGDAGEVENMDAGATGEGPAPVTPDPRFLVEDDAPPVAERQPKGKPDAERREARHAAELRELRREVASLKAAKEAPAPTADPYAEALAVDEDADPIGAIKAFKKAIAADKAADARDRQANEATTAQQNQIRALAQWGGEAEADFRVDNPDYDKAVAHLAQTRVDELKAGGYTAQEAQAELSNELLRVMARCKQTGADPAEAVYKMAQKRGYVLDNGAKQLTLNDKGQRATSPFAGTGSRSGTGGVSVSSVASAPKSTPRAIRAGGDEFDKGFERLKAAAKR